MPVRRIANPYTVEPVRCRVASTIVNVAVPDLSLHFVLGQERAQWVSAGFIPAMTLSMLATPWFLLRYGLRRTYTGAILLLMAGGVIGGFSVNYPMLLAMRVAEGQAAGILQPIPAIVVFRAFDSDERGKAMSIFGFGVVLAPAIGPSVGGFLVEQFGWRSIFFVVVPFCLIVLNGLVHLHHGLAQAAAFLIVGVASFVVFLAYQMRTEQGLVNMKLFHYRQFAMGALVAFIYGAGLFGSTYLLPIHMQMAQHYAPSQAGLVLLPAGIVLAIIIVLAGKLSDWGAPNVMVSIGLGLLALSLALMGIGSAATGYFTLIAWVIVGRIGLCFVLPSLTLGSMRGVDLGLIAQGASTINFLRQLGGAIGVSLVGIVLEWRLAAQPGACRQRAHRRTPHRRTSARLQERVQQLGWASDRRPITVHHDRALQQLRMFGNRAQQGVVIGLLQVQSRVFFFIGAHHVAHLASQLTLQALQQCQVRRGFQILHDGKRQMVLLGELFDQRQCFARFGAARVVINRDHYGFVEKRRQHIIGRDY